MKSLFFTDNLPGVSYDIVVCWMTIASGMYSKLDDLNLNAWVVAVNVYLVILKTIVENSFVIEAQKWKKAIRIRILMVWWIQEINEE